MKAEFGKSEKNPIKPHDFDPVLMRVKLRRGLQQLHPESVAIQFLPKRKDPVIPEPVVAEHVSNNANVERFETGKCFCLHYEGICRDLQMSK